MDDDIPYLLLTPGPLTTSRRVRQAMLQDFCTWDSDYNQIVQSIRKDLVHLATGEDWDRPRPASSEFTAVLMQGSGTFCVEAVLNTIVADDHQLLVVSNGAYGRRMVEIARRHKLTVEELAFAETCPVDSRQVRQRLKERPEISHVALVHCETTTGMLNDAQAVAEVVRDENRIMILDAMSSFGGIPLNVAEWPVDFLVSSANKCIQGTPGFGFVVARRTILEDCADRSRSLSLDLYDQWKVMEEQSGKWRFTSPTHVVRAFRQALDELHTEGGVTSRWARYQENQKILVEGMTKLGFRALLESELQSPIITAFHYPQDIEFDFGAFYNGLKSRRFVIYPGKVTGADTFRIGTIGHVFPNDVECLLQAVAEVRNQSGEQPEAGSP